MKSDTTGISDLSTEAVMARLWETTDRLGADYWQSPESTDLTERPAVVLFLVGIGSEGPELILNERSKRVRQPGDLCCPGGSVMPRIDPILARLLSLPGSPLKQWRHWPGLVAQRPGAAKALQLALATALREGAEEMRLWPLGVRMLMPLPPENLQMFEKQIQPIACWVSSQRRFFPNWEVARVVRLPISRLLGQDGHAALNLKLTGGANNVICAHQFPCYRFSTNGREQTLWGATYRIAMDFLRLVFDYEPPNINDVPVVEMTRGPAYLSGSVHQGVAPATHEPKINN